MAGARRKVTAKKKVQKPTKKQNNRKGKDLASLAAFILKNHLDDFVRELLRVSHEIKIPVLRYFDFTDDELFKRSKIGTKEFLGALAKKTIDKLTTKSLRKWTSGKIPLEQDQIVSDDIILVGHARKQSLLKFIPQFTKDPVAIIRIVKEIDDFILDYSSRSFNTFIALLQERIAEHVTQLQRSEVLFKQAQAVTHIGNYVWELSPPKLTWSDELYRIYDLDPETDYITNELAGSFNHPDDNALVHGSIAMSMRTLEPFNFHYRVILPGRKEKVLHARGEIITGKDGKPIRIFGTAQDVTEQKVIEQRLEQNQIFIQKIADAAPSIIASYHIRTGNYTFISQGLRKLLGYDPSEVLEKGVPFFTGIIHPDDLPEIMEKNNRALQEANTEGSASRNEDIMEFQYRMKHANGEYRWFQTYGTVFSRNNQGEVENILNISLDITEKIKADQVIVQRTKELQQSNASLQEFAFVASHDLKEPLRKISTLSDRILQIDANNLSVDGKTYMQKVINSSIRMQEMIEDLLSLSQISGAQAPEAVNLQQLLDDVLQTFEQALDGKEVVTHSSDLPALFVVPSQFRQLFQNLISNSLKFVVPGRKPVINIHHEYLGPEAVAALNVRPAKTYLQITFTDNGIGFDNKFVDKIFSIFQRLHSRQEYEGTGIGLSICKKVIENHGGAITASGIPDEGATFTIVIPA